MSRALGSWEAPQAMKDMQEPGEWGMGSANKKFPASLTFCILMMLCLDMGLFGFILITRVVMIFCGLYIVCHMMPPAFPLPEHYWSLQCPYVLGICTKLCKSGSCPLSQHHCQQKEKIRCKRGGIKSQQGRVREGCQDSWMGCQTSQSPCTEGVVQFYSNLKGQDLNWCSAKILTQKKYNKKENQVICDYLSN